MPRGINKADSDQSRMEALGLEILFVEIPKDLKKLVGEAADAQKISLTDYVAQLLAREVGRPDLGTWPKKRPGRPRKDLSATS